MTPKEKAKKLVSKFNKHTVVAINHYPNGKMVENKDEAKQCALIAVDEIIMFMEADDFDSDTCYWANHSNMKYWLEVKKEIEKL